jgi:phospholipid/cholesterol/gamma-HCH transport system substrate-binding protein
VTATFSDIGDLAQGAPVTLADIEVGSVATIELAGTEALVTLDLDPKARVPEGVVARVRRTSVLGERIVDIVLPEDLTEDTPLLADGDHIDDTLVRSDLEDLVAEGSDLFGALSASQLAILIDEGGKGFGGNGLQIRNLLSNYQDIIGSYQDESTTIVSLIHSLRDFNDTLAPKAGDHARSLVNSEKALRVLKEESLQLEQAILSLNRLAKGGKSFLNAHVDDMSTFFKQMRVILGVLDEEQSSIAQFLKWAPGHNFNTQAVEYSEFNQVVQQFIICGLNDDPTNPARDCSGDDSS